MPIIEDQQPPQAPGAPPPNAAHAATKKKLKDAVAGGQITQGAYDAMVGARSWDDIQNDINSRPWGDINTQYGAPANPAPPTTTLMPPPGDIPAAPPPPTAPPGNVPSTPPIPGQNPTTAGPPPVTGTVPAGPESGAPTNTPGSGPVNPPNAPPPPPPISPRPPMPAIDQGPPGFANDMRGDVYAPGGRAITPSHSASKARLDAAVAAGQVDPSTAQQLIASQNWDAISQLLDDSRQNFAQDRTDRAANALATGASYSDRAASGTDRYRSILGNGQVDFRAGPNTGDFERLDPNARFRAINTDLEPGPDVAGQDPERYVAEQDAALAALGGPSRTELARIAAADLRDQGARDLEQRFRKVGQTAAKFGRLGMGDVNAELGSIQGDYERDLLRAENDLARGVAEGDIADRFRRVDTTAGLRGQESDIGAGLRGEQRTERAWDTGIDEANIARRLGERDTELGLDERNIGRRAAERDTATAYGERQVERGREDRRLETALDENNQARAFDRARSAIDYGGRDASQDIGNEYDQLGAFGGLEDRIFGEGQSNRDEYRTERGYQQGTTQQSLDNRIREQQIQEAIKSNDITRAIALMQAGGRVPNLDQLVA